MPTVNVTNGSGDSSGTVELSEQVFGAPVDRSLLHSAVVMQRASARQGTAATRGRGEVAGSGKKPWKQKHTGRARAGSVRSPIWRHGGIVFGPQPRSYAFHIPKKQYRAALRGALTSKASSGDVLVVEGLTISEPKTRLLAAVLSKLGLSKTVLIVADESYDQLERAARNLSGVKLVKAEGLNVYDLLRYGKLVVTKEAAVKIQECWS